MKAIYNNGHLLCLATITLAALAATSCINNERRPENQAACVDQHFGTLMPYPGNCSLFLVCDCEYPTVQNCAGGTWFSNKQKVCVFPQASDCKSGGGIPTQSPTQTSASTSTSTWTTENTSPTDLPCLPHAGVRPTLCLSFEDGTLFPYPLDCHYYINCTNHCPILNLCAIDKVFNTLLMICDTPDTAHCEVSTLPVTTPGYSTAPHTPTRDPKPSTSNELPSSPTTPGYSTVPHTPTRGPKPSTSNELPSSPTTPGYSTVPHTPTRGPKPSTSNELPSSPTTPGYSTAPTSGPETSAPPPMCQPQKGVPADFCEYKENGSFHYYMYNCSAYIACNLGCAEVNYCKSGTYFNPEMEICDFPDDVVCDEFPMPTTTAPSTTVTSTPPPAINELSCLDLPSHTLLPYPEDCAKYVECLDGQVHVRTCLQGLLFNAALLICDEPQAVACYDEIGGTTPAISPTVPTTQLPDTTSSPSTITTNSPTTSLPVYGLCVGQSNGTTFPDTENCQLYYYCWGNDTSTIISCPYVNWYNPKTGDCGPDVSTNACRDTSAAMCAHELYGKAFPISTNCAQYTMCTDNGNYLILNCPRNNFFNPATGNCGPDVSPTACSDNNESTTPAITITTSAATTPAPTAVHGICGQYSNGEKVPYPDNCSKYIVCVYPVPIAHSCPNNWYFNEVRQECDLPENTSCGQQNPEPGNPTTASATTTLTTLPSSTNPTMTTPKPLQMCAGVADGTLIPYPGSCEKFIICELPIPRAAKCQPGFEFNAELQICMLPENANCSIKTSTTEKTTTVETSTTSASTTSITTTSGPLTCADLPNEFTLPYPADCSKYIICIDGAEMVLPCFPATYYNKVTGLCDSQTSPNACRDETTVTKTTLIPSTPPTILPSTPPSTLPTTPLTTLQTTPPATLPTTSPATLPTTPLTPIPSTPPTPIPSTPPTTPGCNTSPSTTVLPTLTTPATTELTTLPAMNGICYGKADGTLVPYPNECNKYIKCASPIPIGFYCPDGLQFNAQLLECVEPELANCFENRCANQPDGTTFPISNQCYSYIKCTAGFPMQVLCPKDSYFNPVKGECDSNISSTACMEMAPGTTTITPITTTEPYKQNVCCGQNVNVRIPYPNDPSKYIKCKYPIPEAVDCPKGATFNESMLKCTLVPEGV